MPILYKYILKEIAKYFTIVLAAVMGVYLMVDFFEKVDNFVSSGVETRKAVALFIYNLPLIVTQVLPFALLLAVLVALGVMNRNNEIIALKSGGIGIIHLIKPVIAVSLLMTVVLFLLSETVIPITAPKANRIWIQDIKKKDMTTTREKNIWIRDKRRIAHITYYNAVKQTAFDVSLYFFDDRFNLIRRLDAETGVFEEEKWRLYNVVDQVRDPEDTAFRTRVYASKTEQLGLSPADLRRISRKSEEMGFVELYEYVEKMKADEYDVTTLRVDLHAKAAFPFICVIMGLLGTGIGVRKSTREGMPVGIAYGIGIAFLYWMFHSFSVSLGYGGLLPPVVAAWAADAVFLSWAIYFIIDSAFEGG
ncbi:MAG: LPS export ABC transporter permease LptG [Desulfobacterales bacterium]